MGASSSRSAEGAQSKANGPEAFTLAESKAPRTAWSTTADNEAPAMASSRPDYGGDGDESDSDVEYDARTLGAPTPMGSSYDYAMSGAAPSDAITNGSMPTWAQGGAADEPCSSSLELQFVYGVRGTDCRRNTFFTASGEIAFHSAALVILYEPRRHAQRFLRGHDAEVRCLALHPSGRVLASGQSAGGQTEICVWQLDATEPAIILSGAHPAGVACLSFSPSGERIAAVGADANHTLVLWDWKRGTPLAAQPVDGGAVFALAWSPTQAALATVGVGGVQLWGVDAHEKGLTGRSAQLLPSSAGGKSFPFAKKGDGQGKSSTRFLCCSFLRNGMLVAGTSRGEVWCWSGTSLCARFRAHDGPIFCLEVERTEGWLLSGGKDGRLRLWSPSVWPNPSGGRQAAATPAPLRMVDLRKLAIALADSAGRPRMLGTPCLRAVHWVGTSILMGTRCGELLHLDYSSSSDSPDVTLLLQGHAQLTHPVPPMRTHGGDAVSQPTGPCCAVACHPSLPLLASTAADLTLRLWDVQQRQMEGLRMLPAPACDLAFAPTSDTLVCALGEAGLLMLDAATLHDLLTLPLGIGSGGATCLAFSPDGAILAVGTDRGAIELRAAGGLWDLLGSCGVHPAPVIGVDWSDDGSALQSNCAAGYHYFWDARTCAQLEPAAASGFAWASSSCPRQWGLAGLPEVLGAGSAPVATRRANGGGVVACAGTDGALTLVGYPSASADAAALRYADGCGTIRGLAWSCDDGVLISLSESGELFQWRHLGGEPSDNSATAAAAAADEAAYDSDIEHELKHASLTRSDGIVVSATPAEPYAAPGWGGGAPSTDASMRLVKFAGSGGDSGAGVGGGALVPATGARVSSHHAELHPPTVYAPAADAHEAPPDALQLDWVYGCRGHDTHGAVAWTAGGEVAFPAACVCGLYDPRAHTQRFFLGHSNDVLAMAVHPSGLAIASGQAGTAALSCVWDARTCEPISVLRGVHSLGVCALAFDSSGERLASCGLEASHRVALWDWRRGVLIGRVATGAPRIFALAFAPPPPHAPAATAPIELAAVGVRTAAFIFGRADAGALAAEGGYASGEVPASDALLRCKRGVWGGRAPQATLLCASFASEIGYGGECYTGSTRGDIIVWRDRCVVRSVSAHAGPVFAIARVGGDVAGAAGEGELFFSAGKGGKIRRWGGGLRALGTIDLREPLAALTDAWGRPLIFRNDSPAIRSLDVDASGRILLATAAGEVAVLVPSTGELSLLLQGHAPRRGKQWPGTLSGLATHPTKALAATAGAEGSLRLWSLDAHALLACRPLPAAASAAAFSPDGSCLAVGLSDGGWLLLDAESLRPVDAAATAAAAAPMSERAARGSVGCVAFSPDGAMLAAGCADGSVVILAHVRGGWQLGYHRVASATGHGGAVLQIDWSEEPVVLTGGVGSNTVGAAGATECWLLRTAAAHPEAVDRGGVGEPTSELLHWEVVCEREAAASATAAAAGVVGATVPTGGGGGAPAVSSAAARRVAHATAVRDVSWASDTTSLCWGALGPATKAGLAVDSSGTGGLRPVSRSHEGELLAAADARGGVSLWRWPAASSNAMCKRYGGHAKPPSALAFSHDDGLLLTCGGSDLTLMQWRHVPQESLSDARTGAGATLIGGGDAYDSDVAPDFLAVDLMVHPPRSRGRPIAPSRLAFLEASSLAQAARASGADLAAVVPSEPSPLGALSHSTALMALDELVQKQRFHAIRPWLRGLEPPTAASGLAPASERAPVESLELSWVHGARVHDVRHSLLMCGTGELVYPAAALVVLVAPPPPSAPAGAPAAQQRYYRGHSGGVSALALHPNGVTLASASLGADPAIHVWDAASLHTLAALRGAHSGGIGSLAFSPASDGSLLASCDLATSPLLALWDWRKGELLASARAGRARVLGIAFSPVGALVTHGAGPLRFWTADGTKLASRRGMYHGAAPDGSGAGGGGPGGGSGSRTITCVAFGPDGEVCYAGTADGCVQRWTTQGVCDDIVSVNRQQPIFALHCSAETGLLAAGKGGRLLWWPGHRPAQSGPLRASDARTLDLGTLLGAAADEAGRPLAYLTGRAPCVRAMAAAKDSLSICTRGGEVWHLPLPWDAPIAHPSAGPAFGPEGAAAPLALDASALAAPRLLAQGHSAPKRSRKGEGEACALAPDPTNADQFVTGGDDGSVRVWSISKQRMIAMRVLPQPVTSLAYTNDGAHLAAGCEGGGVHVLHADSLADALVFSLAPYTSYGGGAAASAEADADAAGISRLGGRATFTVATLVGSKGGGGGGGGDAIGVLSYSPDDTMLAVGLASGAVEILAVGSHYRRLHSCVGHAAPVLHLDWSIDGQYVQTCCARCEYAFWEAQTGARVMQLGSMCDVAWATWTAPLGLPVQGVYPKLSDGSDIHAAHRSPDGRLLVTCDEFRKVNLFRHPCGPGSAACRAVAAHASRVGAVRFSADGRYVISIGGPDLSVLVWKVAGPS